MRKFCFILSMMMLCLKLMAQKPVPQKPRLLISTDIGGTDPDDNQSMAHLLMYNNLFKLEGLVSSPSYGDGNKAEILRMIGLYEKDLPKLRQHVKDYASPDELRAITKQGQHGEAPFKGIRSLQLYPDLRSRVAYSLLTTFGRGNLALPTIS